MLEEWRTGEHERSPLGRLGAWVLAIALALAMVGPTRARTSWFDEAIYASRAVRWMDSGRTNAAYLAAPQVDARLFVVHPIALGEVFHLFGASLLTNRLFGLACHAVACLALYAAFARLRIDRTARLLAVAAMATDAGFTWFVRSGRPDTLVLTLLSLCLLGLVLCVTSTRPVTAALAGGLAGVAGSLALLTHLYSIPWLGALSVGFCVALLGASGGRRLAPRLAGFLGAVLGAVVVLAPYLAWIGHDPAARSSIERLAEILLGSKAGSSAPSLELELRRWGRATLLHPFRWAVVLIAFPRVERYRGMYLGCLVAIAGYFVLLWQGVPHDTWYQVGYVVLPLSTSLALAFDAWSRSARPLRAGPVGRAVPLLAAGALVEGVLCTSLFPAAALLQWRERSYSRLGAELRETLPEDARVATQFGAYLALVENGLRPVFVDDLRRQADDASKRLYHERILERGFRFVILSHGRSPAELGPDLGSAVRFVRTVGAAKEPLPFAADAPYHYDVYSVRPGSDSPRSPGVGEAAPGYHPRGVAGHDLPVVDIPHRHRPGSDHRTPSDPDARAHESLRRDPGVVLHQNRATHEGEVAAAMVAGGRTQMRALRHGDAGTEPDRTQRVQDDARTDCRLVADLEAPGLGDRGRGIDHHSRSDPRAEATQHPAAPGVQRRGRPREERPDPLPQGSPGALAAAGPGPAGGPHVDPG